MSDLSESKFLSDVEQHEIQVLHDDGIYRHMRFKHPETSNLSFSIVTWPGHLAYTGDMGAYTFQRIHDMFEFFRTDRKHAHSSNSRGDKQLVINPSYWAEKVVAQDRGDGIEEFDHSAFERVVKENFREWLRENFNCTTKEQRRDLWEEIQLQVLGADTDKSGVWRYTAASSFSSFVNDEVGDFSFQDFWEYHLQKPSYRYLWCCYAIAWGVKKYDELCMQPA
jgi:hypothetical protein